MFLVKVRSWGVLIRLKLKRDLVQAEQTGETGGYFSSWHLSENQEAAHVTGVKVRPWLDLLTKSPRPHM